MKSELTKAHNYSLLERSILSAFGFFFLTVCFFFLPLPSLAGYLSKHSHATHPHAHHQSAASLILSNQTRGTRIY